MQASQTKINQEVAVALERLSGRMDAAEQRLKELEDYRREEDKRREERIDKAPDNKRADLAILISACTALIYLISLLAAHWH